MPLLYIPSLDIPIPIHRLVPFIFHSASIKREHLAEMVRHADDLSVGLDMTRVDFYITDEGPVFGRLCGIYLYLFIYIKHWSVVVVITDEAPACVYRMIAWCVRRMA
jgi:hypothetical protein